MSCHLSSDKTVTRRLPILRGQLLVLTICLTSWFVCRSHVRCFYIPSSDAILSVRCIVQRTSRNVQFICHGFGGFATEWRHFSFIRCGVYEIDER